MSFFTFLTEADDLFQNATVAANSGDLSKAQTSDISELCVSSTLSGGFDNFFAINLGSPQPWNQICLINHNFDPSVVFTLYSKASGSANPFSYDYTATMTWREFDMYFRTSSTRTDQYIGILLHDTVTAEHYQSIGRILIGLAVTLTSNFNYDWELRRKVLNKSKRSEVNSRSVDRVNEYKELVFTFEEMTDAQLASLTAFTDALHGDAVYCFIIPDPAVYDGYLMTLSSEVVEVHHRRNRLLPLTFTEESRGVRISP